MVGASGSEYTDISLSSVLHVISGDGAEIDTPSPHNEVSEGGEEKLAV